MLTWNQRIMARCEAKCQCSPAIYDLEAMGVSVEWKEGDRFLTFRVWPPDEDEAGGIAVCFAMNDLVNDRYYSAEVGPAETWQTLDGLIERINVSWLHSAPN